MAPVANPSMFMRFFGLSEPRGMGPAHGARSPAAAAACSCVLSRGAAPRHTGSRPALPPHAPQPRRPLLPPPVENQPLYLMVSIACGLAVYTPIRHLVRARRQPRAAPARPPFPPLLTPPAPRRPARSFLPAAPSPPLLSPLTLTLPPLPHRR
jgi:hypothetical protein